MVYFLQTVLVFFHLIDLVRSRFSDFLAFHTVSKIGMHGLLYILTESHAFYDREAIKDLLVQDGFKTKKTLNAWLIISNK